jgi:3-(methylthio)propanoyl-CoA dehydrogenase
VNAYTPPTADQLLAIRVNAGIEELAQTERFAHAEPDLVEAIVEGVGQFAAGEFAPLNRVGDLEGRAPRKWCRAPARWVQGSL